VADTSA